jgi:hypothetical protein
MFASYIYSWVLTSVTYGGDKMNWIKFVENHNSEIRIPKIKRSLYSYGRNSESHSTLVNFYRTTEKMIHY